MSQSSLMRERRFAPLFWVQFLGALNDNVFRFALIIFVTFTLAERTGMDTRTLVVMTGAVFILPFFLFSAIAGQLADRYEKSALVRHIKTIEVLVMGLGAVGFVLGDYYFLLGVLFLMGCQSTFFGPLKYGLLPQHLPPELLTGGNGLIQMGTYVAILSGSMLGGILASLGDDAPYAIIASVVGLALLGRLAAAFIPPAAPNDAQLKINFNPLTSTLAVFRQALAVPEYRALILLISGFWFIGATYLSVVPTYGKLLLSADEKSVTALTAAFTLGIGAGSLSCEKLSRRRIELGLVPIAAVIISLASLDVWLAGIPELRTSALTLDRFFYEPAALRMFIDLVVIGAAGALYIVPLYAALQARVEAAQCARILAALNVVNALFMVGSAVFTIVLFQFGASIPGVFAVVGVLNLIAIAIALVHVPEFAARSLALLRPGRP